MHSLLYQAEAPVDYEYTVGSVPGRDFAFKATNTCSCTKGRERKKGGKTAKRFSLFYSLHTFYVSSLINQNDLGEIRGSICNNP